MATVDGVGDHGEVSPRRSVTSEGPVSSAVFRRRRRAAAALGAVVLAVVVVAVLAVTGAFGGSAGTGSKPEVRTGPRSTSPGHPVGSAPTSTTHPQTQPPYAVQSETITLDDPTRDTPARGDVAAVSGRVLSTIILRPAGLSGPLPVIVFAHGWDSDPSRYTTLLPPSSPIRPTRCPVPR
jgi:hypothetical protein